MCLADYVIGRHTSYNPIPYTNGIFSLPLNARRIAVIVSADSGGGTVFGFLGDSNAGPRIMSMAGIGVPGYSRIGLDTHGLLVTHPLYFETPDAAVYGVTEVLLTADLDSIIARYKL